MLTKIFNSFLLYLHEVLTVALVCPEIIHYRDKQHSIQFDWFGFRSFNTNKITTYFLVWYNTIQSN